MKLTKSQREQIKELFYIKGLLNGWEDGDAFGYDYEEMQLIKKYKDIWSNDFATDEVERILNKK